MPIRADLRHFYRTPEWRAARARVMARAGDKCEHCGKPNRANVWTSTGVVELAPRDRLPYMFWSPADSPRLVWHNQFGELRELSEAMLSPASWPRLIRVVIGVAHLNHVPGDERDENLRALCQWCHLHHDKQQHAQTRGARKDASRPIQWEGALAV
jgi:5-methylcytosine-specific restriction endonuclease McrA